MTPRHLFVLFWCGMLASACVGGSEIKSPAVQGLVYDARTNQPVSGAAVSFVKNYRYEQPGTATFSEVSDEEGQFSLPMQYGYGIFWPYSYFWPDASTAGGDITVRIVKPGYRAWMHTVPYNFSARPFTSLQLDAALEPSR